jgi:hypothetical protein
VIHLQALGGIVKGLALGDGGWCMRETIVKAGGLGDATQALPRMPGDPRNGIGKTPGRRNRCTARYLVTAGR